MKESEYNPLSIAAQPLNRLIGSPYYDLNATMAIIQRLYDASLVEGVEFQNLAEYDARTPPRDEAELRLQAWQQSQKHNIVELAEVLQECGMPINTPLVTSVQGSVICWSRINMNGFFN